MSTLSAHQARYFAWELSRRRAASEQDRLATSLFDAHVDVNPHQIEAALFALNNPLSKGVILADEVGLGKTIEAALVLCQLWAERRRRLLVICPAALRKQWAQELQDKFNLPTQVLDLKTWNIARQQGVYDPFNQDKISIVSYPFAVRMELAIGNIPWDLVVLDEAHRLRNSHRTSHKAGSSLKKSLAGRKKILLTATPLQNSLMELYGLTSMIDEHIFGDEKSFRARFSQADSDLQKLKTRLQPFVQRTLRKDVLEYVPYTKRHAITIPFAPNDAEQRLYEQVSTYLQRDFSYAFPQQQKHLIALVLRKLLASSTPAVISTLEAIRDRLRQKLDQQTLDEEWLSHLVEDDELDEELLDDLELSDPNQDIDWDLLQQEIKEIDQYIEQAKKIGEDRKSYALLQGIRVGFERMHEMGARQKAVIFTESKRTQAYLVSFLEAHGFAGKVVSFSGDNNSLSTTGIYQRWLARYQGSDRVTGSSAIDRRTALIDYFRDEAQILIATEAAAEGVNLQFCSLVLNYDLPWNPQRVEQRIGRCHRYGQAFDVVVVNFLNERNAADQRVLELLTDKFHLFDGVFGASDHVLGQIEKGMDFEQRIAQIYDHCRSPEEIEQAFAQLRNDLEHHINQKMQQTQALLIEHFDSDIHDLLKIQKQRAEDQLDRISRLFWAITQYALHSHADFDPTHLSFILKTSPRLQIEVGNYQLLRKGESLPEHAHVYRLTHPLGQYVIELARNLDTPIAHLTLHYTGHQPKISALQPWVGQSGWLAVSVLTLESFDVEEHLILTAISDTGSVLDHELTDKLLSLPASTASIEVPAPKQLVDQVEHQRQVKLTQALADNDRFFQREREKLEQWAEDRLLMAEKALEDVKIKLQSLKRLSRQAISIEEVQQLQDQIKATEREQRKMRQEIFDVEDEIETRRDALIDALKQRLHRASRFEQLFVIRWTII